MTLLLDRPTNDAQRQPPPSLHRRRAPWRQWLADHRVSVMWATPLVLLSGVIHAWGMHRAPQRVDDEGTYMAQAYAVQHFGELAHYTYWYDHPPLGWLQIAAWTTTTGGFDRAANAIAAGRELMLLAHLVTTALLWVLARQLRLSRPLAAVAVVAYALSPLGLYFHRMVYLDNIAVAWTVAAFTLATVRHRQLLAFAGGAVCFAAAVLTKETFVLLLPPLAWVMWRTAHPETRRYTLAVASTLFVLLCSGYLALALLKRELIPSPDRVSLFEAVKYQLVDRPGSGSIFTEHSAASDIFTMWFGLDPVLLIAGSVSAVALLLVRRMRPFAVAYLMLALMLVRPGYLPIPYVVVMLPFAALLPAAALHEGLRYRWLQPAVAVAVAVAAVMLATLWPPRIEQLTKVDADRPMAQAKTWITGNVQRDQRILVDDALWVDLVSAGYPRRNVVWYFKADTDPALSPGGRDPRYDYMMVSRAVRGTLAIGAETGRTPYRQVLEAYQHSVLVASYGDGADRVDIRRIEDEGRGS